MTESKYCVSVEEGEKRGKGKQRWKEKEQTERKTFPQGPLQTAGL